MKTLFGLKSHYTFGRGVYSPTRALEEAKSLGFTRVFTSDEVELAGLPEFLDAGAKLGVDVVPGWEIPARLQAWTYPLVISPLRQDALPAFLKLTRETQIDDHGDVYLNLDGKNLSGLSVVTAGLHGFPCDAALRGARHEIPAYLGALSGTGAMVAVGLPPDNNTLGAVVRDAVGAYPIVPFQPQIFASKKDARLARAAKLSVVSRRSQAPVFIGDAGLFRSIEEMAAQPEWDSRTVGRWVGQHAAVAPQVVEGGLDGDAEKSIIAVRSRAIDGLDRLVNSQEIPAAQRSIYRLRIDEEAAAVKKMKAENYLALVVDLGVRLREEKVLYRIRGSAVNSALLYLSGLSGIDPVKGGLAYERFLNPSRTDLPDVDFDVETGDLERARGILAKARPDATRLRALDHWGVKAALEHCAVVFKVKDRPEWLNSIRAILPGGEWPGDWEDFQKVRGFRKLESENEKLFAVASAMVGLPCRFKLHPTAVGVGRALESMPYSLAKGKGGELVFSPAPDWRHCDKAGVVINDLLSCEHLTTLKELAVRCSVPLEILDKPIPAEEIQSLKFRKLLNEGYVTGVFQFGGNVGRRLTTQAKPSTFDEISQVNALIRVHSPETQGVIRRYIDGGKAPIAALAPFVSDTRGVLLYQEQILKAVSSLSGAPLAEADLWRRSIKSKDASVRKPIEDKLLAALNKRGASKAEVDQILGELTHGGAYTFAKGHSDSYAAAISHDLYFKSRYPAEFLVVSIDRTLKKSDEWKNSQDRKACIARAIYEARHMGVGVQISNWKAPNEKSVARGNQEKPEVILGLDMISFIPTAERAKVLEVAKAKSAEEAVLSLAKAIGAGKATGLIMSGWFDDGKEGEREHLIGLFQKYKRYGQCKEIVARGPAYAEKTVLGFAVDRSHPGFYASKGARYAYQIEPDEMHDVTKVSAFIIEDAEVKGKRKTATITNFIGEPELAVDVDQIELGGPEVRKGPPRAAILTVHKGNTARGEAPLVAESVETPALTVRKPYEEFLNNARRIR